MKKYTVKKIFGPTIQGEGSLIGNVTTFVRLSGCNMWNGIAADKANSKCPYCDTDFFGGVKMSGEEILNDIEKTGLPVNGWVTISGGEPLLQVDENLLRVISSKYQIAIETNGTVAIPDDCHGLIDHVTCSPKVPVNEIKIAHHMINDLKVLYPHPSSLMEPEQFMAMNVGRIFIQPINNEDSIDLHSIAKSTRKLFELNEKRPVSLSIQMHKVIGVE